MSCSPAPREQVIELADWVISDEPSEGIGEKCLRIDTVEFAGFDERSEDGPMLAAPVRRDLIMPGVWGARQRSHIHSTRCSAVCDRGRRSLHNGGRHLTLLSGEGPSFLVPGWSIQRQHRSRSLTSRATGRDRAAPSAGRSDGAAVRRRSCEVRPDEGSATSSSTLGQPACRFGCPRHRPA